MQNTVDSHLTHLDHEHKLSLIYSVASVRALRVLIIELVARPTKKSYLVCKGDLLGANFLLDIASNAVKSSVTVLKLQFVQSLVLIFEQVLITLAQLLAITQEVNKILRLV